MWIQRIAVCGVCENKVMSRWAKKFVQRAEYRPSVTRQTSRHLLQSASKCGVQTAHLNAHSHFRSPTSTMCWQPEKREREPCVLSTSSIEHLLCLPCTLAHTVPFLDLTDVCRLRLVCKRFSSTHHPRMRAFLFPHRTDSHKHVDTNTHTDMWRSGWFRAAAWFQARYPKVFSTRLSRRDMAVYRTMRALHPHLSDTAGVCGSFALHVAEQQMHPARARRWTPGDIDLFLAGEDGLRKTADILMGLKRRGCGLELIRRASGEANTSGALPDTRRALSRQPAASEVIEFLRAPHTHTQPHACRRTHRRLEHTLRRIVEHPHTDSHYKFGLLDVCVDGELILSFVLCAKHPDIVQAMAEFDLSVCRMALQTDATDEFVVHMAPCVERDFHLGRCSGLPLTAAACPKLRSRVKKYADRGYRFVGNRCACEGMCGGSSRTCPCAGRELPWLTPPGNCTSAGCCRVLWREEGDDSDY